jgi:hypothetical protein
MEYLIALFIKLFPFLYEEILDYDNMYVCVWVRVSEPVDRFLVKFGFLSS